MLNMEKMRILTEQIKHLKERATEIHPENDQAFKDIAKAKLKLYENLLIICENEIKLYYKVLNN